MRFAPVLPPELYPDMDTGDYHLVQAHLIEHNQRIIEWCKTRRHWNHTLILDNGAAELGISGGDVGALSRVASLVRPDIVVIPDTLGNRKATMNSFQMTLSHMLALAPKVMAVPHGNGIVDSVDCFMDMLTLWKQRGYCMRKLIIGVPKLLDAYLRGGRRLFLHNIVRLHKWPQQQIHLLGLNNDLSELDPILRSFPNLMGWDTTWPCAVGLDNTTIDPSVDTHTSPKRNLTSTEWQLNMADITGPQCMAIKNNIAYCKEYIK